MKTKYLFRFVIALAMASTTTSWLSADQAEDEAAIRKSIASYVAAFNSHDAKAIAALWSPDAVYTNRVTGDQVTGQKNIEQELVAIFKESKDTKIEVDVTSVRFMSPSVAIEEGVARVLRPGAEPDETVYSSVYVKADGSWLLDHMSEEPKAVFRSNYQHLKDLQWMIGTWVDQDDQSRIETTSTWTKNQNFITRKFAISVEGQSDLSGVQVIGWDPVAEKIRSWVFDSDGGFGSSTWKKKDNKWVVNSSATLADGRKASAAKVLTIVADKTITMQATGRTLDGNILPNLEPIKLTRNSDSE